MNNNIKNQQFPSDFLFGASSASYQVEGGITNDWSEWEIKNAKKLAEQGFQPSFLNNSIKTENHILNESRKIENYICGKATDHYNRYKEDFNLAQKLNLKIIRISIEWARIEPQEGFYDDKELQHYLEVLKEIKTKGMQTMVTLWHFTSPLWLERYKYWRNNNTPKLCANYAHFILNKLSPYINYLTVINEPEVYSSKAYFRKDWPPQYGSIFSGISSFFNFAKAHNQIYKICKRNFPNIKVGIIKHNSYFYLLSNDILSKFLLRIYNYFWNHFFIILCNNNFDFIGLNNYFRNGIDKFRIRNDSTVTSDMGWDVFPESLYHCLIELKKYNKPIFITENGIADYKDEQREWFIKESLTSVLRAINVGVNVKGYLHWALTDNFEWDSGFWPRFGLIEIDYKTFKRTIRKSSLFYSKIAKENSI